MRKSCWLTTNILKNGTVFLVHLWQFAFMDKKLNQKQGHHEHPLRQEISNEERKLAEAAHESADEDMTNDAELTATSPNDDLDEGESARLGENSDLI